MDREAIVNGLNLYAGALDAHAWDVFDAVFTPDVEADYPGTLHWHDLATFKRDFAVYHEALASHQHVMTNHQVVVDGDGANSLTYGSFRLFEHDRGAGMELREGACWYDDTWIRSMAGWRIRKRVARVFWATGSAPRGALAAAEQGSFGAGTVGSLFAEAEAGRVAYFNALRGLGRSGAPA